MLNWNLANKRKLFMCFLIMSIVFIFIILYNFIYIKNGAIFPHSPDESSLLFFKENLLENNSFLWKSTLNENYNVSFFRVRGTVEVTKNNYGPLLSPLFILIFTLMALIRFEYFLNPILGMVGVFFFYLLVNRLFNNRSMGLIAATLFALIPTYILYINTLTDLIASLVFWIISLFYFIVFLEKNEIRYLTLTFLFSAVSFLIRPPHILLFIVYLPLIIGNLKLIINKRVIIVGIILFLILVGPWFLVNKSIYGSYIITGRNIPFENEEIQGGFISFPYYGVNFNNILTSIKNYIINYQNLFLIGILLTLISMLFVTNSEKHKVSKNLRYLLYGFLILCSIILVYFGSNSNFYGFNNTRIQSTMSRLFIPVYILSVLCLSYFIKKLNSKLLKAYFIFTLIITLFIFNFSGEGSIKDLQKSKLKGYSYNLIINELPRESVFIVKTYDKFIIPSKKNILLMYNEEDLDQHPEIGLLYPLITDNELVNLTKKILNDGYRVYLSTESNKMKGILENNKFSLIKVKDVPFYEIFFNQTYQKKYIIFRIDDISFEKSQKEILFNLLNISRKYNLKLNLGVIAEPFFLKNDPNTYSLYNNNKEYFEIFAHGYTHTNPIDLTHKGEFWDITSKKPIPKEIQKDHIKKMKKIFEMKNITSAQKIFIPPWVVADIETVKILKNEGYTFINIRDEDFKEDQLTEFVDIAIATRANYISSLPMDYTTYNQTVVDNLIQDANKKLKNSNYVMLTFHPTNINNSEEIDLTINRMIKNIKNNNKNVEFIFISEIPELKSKIKNE